MRESDPSMHQPVRKAVIPAAGLGTRFLPVTKAIPKEMLPLVDKPAIEYVVEEAVGAGLRDILVVSGRAKRAIEDHFDRAPELEAELAAKGRDDLVQQVRASAELARVHFVRQGQALGLGHAVSMAADHVGNEPFLVMLGDDIMVDDSRLLRGMLAAHQVLGCSVIALKAFPPAEISSYGCVAHEPIEVPAGLAMGAGERLVRLTGVVEKPPADQAPSDLAIMGRYILTPEIFDALDRVTPGSGGEIQLTDAIALLLETQPVYGWVFSEGRYDVGKKIDYLRATVEIAAGREDLGPEFRAYLVDWVRSQGLA